MEQLNEILQPILPILEVFLMVCFLLKSVSCFFIGSKDSIRNPFFCYFIGLESLGFVAFLACFIYGIALSPFAIGVAIGLSAQWTLCNVSRNTIPSFLIGVLMLVYLIYKFFVL